MNTLRQAAGWVKRNPFTTGGLLIALGAQAAEVDALGPVALASVFLGRAIITAAEIIREGRDT